jgi:hypothetical protein
LVNETHITYTDVAAPAANTSGFPTNAEVSVSTESADYVVTMIERSGLFPARQFTFKIPSNSPLNTALPVAIGATEKVRGFYFQMSGALNYMADAGTVTLVSKGASTVELQFSGVRLKDNFSGGNESFVISGSTKRS